MSVRVMSDVWRTQLPTAEKMVLLVIADHASDDGTNAWPSQATIALKASLTVRTVQRCVNSMVAKGFLQVEKRGGGSANMRDDRRPHRYTIMLGRLRRDSVSSRPHDMDDIDHTTFTPSTTRHSRPMNSPIEPSIEEGASRFDEFWNVYPRKVGKQAAEKAWAKAVGVVTPDIIISAAARFAADPNRVETFTPHPTTWLNQGRWDDDVLPQRSKEEMAAEEAAERDRRERERSERMREEFERNRRNATPMPESLKAMLKQP